MTMGHSVALLDDDRTPARFYASALESHGITPHLFNDVTDFFSEIEKHYDYSAFVTGHVWNENG
jgi:DNA-binding NtrC family response regulator